MNREPDKQSDCGGGCGDLRLRIVAPPDFVEFAREAIEQSVQELFEKAVRLHPSRLAVKSRDRTWTYGELNRAANRVAHAILAKQPWRPRSEPESNDLAFWEAHAETVAVFMEQGADAVASALGLLKAGRIFMPIDPADPHTRVAFMLDHAPTRVIVTNDKNVVLAEKLAPPDCDVINIDRIDQHARGNNPDLPISPLSPAFLFYTSGSTGAPKGVVHSHRNVLHDLMIKTNLMRLSPSDRMSLLAWATTQAVKLIFSALVNGASLHLFNLKREALAHLAVWMIRERITVQTVSAPILRSVLELLKDDESFPDLRVIRVASDTVYPEDIARLKTRVGSQCFFVNALSSNETGTVCAHVMNGTTPINGVTMPIGFPKDDTEIDLLDENGTCVTGNGVGGIAIRSRYIAPGYWRRPDLTSTAFFRDPNDREILTFRSGDLARMRPDGSFELCGRSDFQVKIRGYRVESTEVESALLQHDNVVQAVVQASENEQGEKRLVGYVVPRTHPAGTTSALHRFLRERLPEYMVPASFVVMDALPLLPTGKTNRRALPAAARTRPVLDNQYVAPRTATEERVVDIWSQVIGIENVGVHDHFMELGGDSLRAGQVMARVMDAFGVDLPVRLMLESATVAQIAAVVERRCTHAVSDGVRNTIARRPGKGPWELAFGQKRLWFLNQLDPNGPAYNMPKLIRLTGALNVTALSEALGLIIARHEVLRTNYQSRAGSPVADVVDSAGVDLPVTDLSGLPESDREGELRRLTAAKASQPFDLERDLKLRCALYRLGPDEHVLLCVTHHIASDEWSRGVLMRELVGHYKALVAGEPSPLPELPIQYSDFARWQAQQQHKDPVRNQLDYWTQCLHDIPAALDLPADRPRPAVQSARGSAYLFTVPRAQFEALSHLARCEDVTMFMLLLAAFNVLLCRYAGQEDVVVGCPVSGRRAVETEDLIGFFVNTLIMRNDLTGNPPFRELLGRVREQALAAYANPDVPFEKLVDHLQPKRDLSGNPLFHMMFDVHQPRSRECHAAGVSFRLMDTLRQTTPFDQAWNVAVTDEGLRVRVEYSTDLFDETTIKRMTRHYQQLLEGIVASPGTPILELALLDAADRRKMLVQWNDTRADYPHRQTINGLFERQVQRTPELTAVVYQDEELSYGELNARANHLAHYLRDLGVGPDVPVGIYVERSLDMVVGLLGILKAGGACVPLDPSCPSERLLFALGDAQVPVLLTQQPLLENLGEHGTRTVCLDTHWGFIAQHSTDNPRSEVKPKSLAYVIYTSGSTGKPKGVAMQHDSLANLIAWQLQGFSTSQPARTLQFGPISFDVSFQEIFSTWCSGGVLVLVDEETRRNPSALLQLVEAKDVERLFLPFTALQQLAEAAEGLESLPTTVREIITAGEQVHITPAIISLFERLNHCVLANQYGPSETHVVTCLTLDGSPNGWPRLPPIGRPIANTQIYILDRHLRPVPVGVTGELHVGGAGLARGYLHRPELTAEKFVPDPFSDESGARLYRTGDLARYRSDGTIEFVGRMDHQFKIRGFRIELGEIEAVLMQHSAVREAVVTVHEPVPGDKRLAAFMVAGSDPLPTDSELRRFLKQKLPDYMVPSAFVLLKALPVTPNGKVDRRNLSMPDSSCRDLESELVAPRDLTERTLARIWAEVLGRETLGIHDNVFELGGHSLLVMRVISRIHQLYSVDLPVRTVFELPTVAELAQYIEAHAKVTPYRRIRRVGPSVRREEADSKGT